MRQTISVVIICKNEEAMIERCLDSVKGFDEYIVVDTGSRDRTIEILRQRGIEPDLGFVWVDNFALCQNYAKSKAKSSWILSIDCDEQLLSTTKEVYAAVEKCKNVLRVTMVAEGDVANTFGFARIFRNTPEIYWEASIHKHLNVPGEGEDCGEIRIMYGYSPAHELDIDRSLRMLEAAVAEDPRSPRNLYYLGREYYYKQRHYDAIMTFEKYLKIAHWKAEAADAYFIMAQCYEALKDPKRMADAVLQAILINPNFKEALDYMALISIPENKPQWEAMARRANNNGLVWVRTQAEHNTNVLFLSPHHDDESLFGAITLMREKPLVIICTSSHIQPERGDLGCTDEIRSQETINAMAIAGCPVVFLGIRDTDLTEEILTERLKEFNPDKVYAPAIQGGNFQHDIVGNVAKKLFEGRVQHYTTYTKTELHTTGKVEIKPTSQELEIKKRMLDCYESQLNLKSTLPHFMAVLNQSEWLL